MEAGEAAGAGRRSEMERTEAAWGPGRARVRPEALAGRKARARKEEDTVLLPSPLKRMLERVGRDFWFRV
eukprot:415794-Hanusia_phi.AAC.1